ncbi:MAG: hypothetical protein AAGD12_00145 [Pseudomonadota bacterium]
MTFPQILAPWRWLPRTNETVFDYWLSLSPAAPYYGVAWRFADGGETAVLSPKTEQSATTLPKIDRAAAQTVEPVAADNAQSDEPNGSGADLADTTSDEPAAPTASEPVDHPEAEDEAPASVTQDNVEVASASQPTELRPTVLLDARPEEINDLKRIKGVGPKLEAELNALGIWRFDQVAALRETDLLWLDARLPTLRGRPARDNWVDQAVGLIAQDASAG